MSAGRKAHDTDARSVDAKTVGMLIYIAQSIFDVGKHVRVFVPQSDNTIAETICTDTCHAVLEHKCVDAVRLQPLCHLTALMQHIMPAITASRTNNDSYSGIGCAICRISGKRRHLSQ